MTGICLPIDADMATGLPKFPGAQHRVALSALMGSAPGRPLGARSGIRPGAEPTVTATALEWTVTPFSFVADPATGGSVGPYVGAFLANEKGPLNAADQNNTRIDRLDVQVPDDPPGADPRDARIVYTPGQPGSGVPAGAPDRTFSLGTLSVPKAGGGLPSFTPTWPYTVAPGAAIPVRNKAERDALLAYNGLRVTRLDTGYTETYNGTRWVGPYFEEYTLKAVGITASSYAMVKDLTLAKIIGDSAFSLATGLWTCPGDDLYEIDFSWLGSVSAGAAVRATTTIINQTTGLALASESKTVSGIPGASVSTEAWIQKGHQVGVYVFYGSGGQAFTAGTRYTFRRVPLT